MKQTVEDQLKTYWGVDFETFVIGSSSRSRTWDAAPSSADSRLKSRIIVRSTH